MRYKSVGSSASVTFLMLHAFLRCWVSETSISINFVIVLSLAEINSGLLWCLSVHINKKSYKQERVVTCIAVAFNSWFELRGDGFWLVGWLVGRILQTWANDDWTKSCNSKMMTMRWPVKRHFHHALAEKIILSLKCQKNEECSTVNKVKG